MTMLEKMAVQIAVRMQTHPPYDGTFSWSHVGWGVKDAAFDAARAALLVIREPDKAVRNASLAEEGRRCPCCAGADDWQIMIDAILDEKPK